MFHTPPFLKVLSLVMAYTILLENTSIGLSVRTAETYASCMTVAYRQLCFRDVSDKITQSVLELLGLLAALGCL